MTNPLKSPVKSPVKSLATATLAGVLLLSGCGSDDDGEAAASKGPAVIAMPVSNSALLVAGPATEEDRRNAEELTGTPTFVNGCLGALSEGKSYLVVWPSGTHVDRPESDTIQLGDEVLEPGQSFAGTGTWVTGKPFPVQFPELPLKCLAPNQENIMWVHEITEISE